jgi:hypothetical protein
VLRQFDDDDILHPVTYFSRKHSAAEINHEIYDKELVAIIHAFKKWCPLLEGFPHTIEVIFDHQNLTYFTTNYLLNYLQTQWFKLLSCFNFEIHYRPGKVCGKADVLTCYGQGS